MNSARLSYCIKPFKRLAQAALLLAPSLASAHPGHFHPGEEDEFDFLTATVFHTHGNLEIAMAAIVVAAVLLGSLSQKKSVRVGAFSLAAASLSVITIF